MRILSNVTKPTNSTMTRSVYEDMTSASPSRVETATVTGDPCLVSYLSKADVVKSAQVEGWRPPLAYSVTDKKETPWTGEFFSWSNGSNYRVQTNQQPHPSPAGTSLARPHWDVLSVPAELVSRAEIKCLVKLKHQNVNYATALAESKQTLGLVGNALLRYSRALLHAKKGRWKQAAEALGVKDKPFSKASTDIAGRWLEMQYGWLPLVNDVYGALQDWQQRFEKVSPTISVKHTLVSKEQRVKPFTVSGIPCFNRVNNRILAFVRLDYTVINPALIKGVSLGVINPAEVAWELVPYSFAVDWFLPVGAWISSFDAAFGLTFRGGSLTTVIDSQQHATCSLNPPMSSINKPNSSGLRINAQATYKEKTFVRSVYNSTPWPIPRFKNPVSTTHALNAFALFITAKKLH